MKIKVLRTKKEPKEFVHIDYDEQHSVFSTFTSDIPKPQPSTATIDKMVEHYPHVNFDEFEMVEFELVELNTIGADIRNKLTPPKNLIAMLELFFSQKVGYLPERAKLVNFIKVEMEKSKKILNIFPNYYNYSLYLFNISLRG